MVIWWIAFLEASRRAIWISGRRKLAFPMQLCGYPISWPREWPCNVATSVYFSHMLRQSCTTPQVVAPVLVIVLLLFPDFFFLFPSSDGCHLHPTPGRHRQMRGRPISNTLRISKICSWHHSVIVGTDGPCFGVSDCRSDESRKTKQKKEKRPWCNRFQ